jgi:hypothetical protein
VRNKDENTKKMFNSKNQEFEKCIKMKTKKRQTAVTCTV